MDIDLLNQIEGVHKSALTQPIAVSSAQPIRLQFPSIVGQAWHKLRNRSLLIDTCLISYIPQCPFNATGKVRITIYDTRLIGDDAKQAEFAFPVDCQTNLTYYANAYSSVGDSKCPWHATYQLDESNILTKFHFCKIKAIMKLSTSKYPEQLPFRSTTIKVLNERYDDSAVDVWHCGYAKPIKALYRSTSTSISRDIIRAMPNLSHSSIISSRLSVSSIPEHLIHDKDDITDIGPSGSDVESICSEIGLTEDNIAAIASSVAKKSLQYMRLKDDSRHKPPI